MNIFNSLLHEIIHRGGRQVEVIGPPVDGLNSLATPGPRREFQFNGETTLRQIQEEFGDEIAVVAIVAVAAGLLPASETDGSRAGTDPSRIEKSVVYTGTPRQVVFDALMLERIGANMSSGARELAAIHRYMERHGAGTEMNFGPHDIAQMNFSKITKDVVEILSYYSVDEI